MRTWRPALDDRVCRVLRAAGSAGTDAAGGIFEGRPYVEVQDRAIESHV